MKIFACILFIILCGTLQAQTIITPNSATSSTPINIPVTVPSAYSYGPTIINSIRTWQPNKPITDGNVISATSSVTDVQQTTQYLDGLGRPLQTVSRAITPAMKDMVAPVIYDEFGRETYKYLPYVSTGNDGTFKTNPFSEQQTFMQSQYSCQGEIFFYGKTEYEASPLNRVNKTMAPGNSWAGSNRGVEMKYWINTPTDDVKIWSVTDNSGGFGTYTVTGTYDEGTLYKIVSVDEHGKQVIEFKDKEGKVILKKVQLTAIADDGSGRDYINWLCTYYIYDDLNDLRCVIQPKGVELINPNWILTDATILSEQCFRYEYDERHRMIMKKVPGAAEVYMLYDKRDRLVFSQDGNMRPKNWWMTNLYDVLNRPVATGITIATRSQLETALNAQSFEAVNVTTQGSAGNVDLAVNTFVPGTTTYQASNSITFNPGFSSDGGQFVAEIVVTSTSPSSVEVSGNPIPSSATFTALTLSYFDNYSFTQKNYDNTDNGKLDAGANSFPEALPSSKSLLTKGIATGGKVWVLEDPNDLSKGRWLENVIFYDEKGRPVQIQNDNYKGGLDKATTLYDFTSKALCTYTLHNNPLGILGTIRIKTNMDYDHAGRLLTITKQLNDAGTSKIIVQNEYDELGQLKNKKLGADPTTTSQPLETLAYEYNIRGWFKGVNKNYVNNTSNTNYFGQTLSYDYGFNVPLGEAGYYNGNIAGQQWRSKGDGEQRAYGYDYDATNRILKADFTQNNGGWNNSALVDFSVSNLTYDANGNIKTMKQIGLKLTSSSQVDDMTYNYITNTNRLLNVIDASNDAQTKLGDFRTSINHPVQNKDQYTTDYTYDDNGNLKKDLNKDIGTNTVDGIIYNYLNLPAKVTVANKGTIEYLYDAIGSKLEKKTVDNTVTPAKTTVTSYINGFVYENDVLQFTGHEEGRIRYNATTNTFAYDYFIKDHLGNVRAVLTDEVQVNRYPTATLEGTGAGSPVIKEKEYYDFNDTYVESKITLPAYTNDNGTNNPNTFGNKYDNSQKMYRLNAASNRTGLSKVLKVMAGDKLDILGKSYYEYSGGTVTNTLFNATDLISLFLGTGGSNNSAVIHGATTAILNANNTGTINPINLFTNNNPVNSSNNVKAGICYIIFDEQFKFVSGNFDPVSSANSGGIKSHFLHNIAIPKNGYIYIYCSNESNINVFFDNLEVVHTRSPILEETHYYPFGLTMAGISSTAAQGTSYPTNKKKYNNYELNSDFDINLYETFYRSHDPQLGRFWQPDPKPNFEMSLYSAMDNNPIRYGDILGDTVIYMIDREGAGGNGHMGMFFQNEQGNWFFFSQGATGNPGTVEMLSASNTEGGVDIEQIQVTETRAKTDSKGNVVKGRDGKPIMEKVTRNPTKAELITAAKAGIGGNAFDEFTTMNTSKAQDKQISANAFELQGKYQSGGERYNLYFNNCVDACQDATQKNSGINLPFDGNPKPNAYYNQLSQYVKWFNLPPAEKQKQIDEMVKKQRAKMAKEPKF